MSKKPQKPPSLQPPAEKPVQGDSSKGKQPIGPATEQPIQAGSGSKNSPQLSLDKSTQTDFGVVQGGSGSKNSRQLPLDKSTQTDFEVVEPRPTQQVQSGTEGKQRQDPPTKQWVQSKPKGKQPVQPPSEQPVQPDQTSENVQSGPNKGKQPVRSPSEHLVQPDYTSENVQGGSNKGKHPVRPPTKQPTQAGSVSKTLRQLPLDKSMRADPEVVQPHPQQQVQSDIKGKQRQDLPAKLSEQGNSKGKQPIRSPSEHPVQPDHTSENVQGGSNKGKQPIRHPTEQPVQAGSGSKNPQQLPMRAVPEVTQPRPEQQVQSGTEGKQRQDLPAKLSEQSKSKGKQPISKPLYGNPRRLIARIPVKKDARIKRVEVSIGPDTAFRHPQTFFFKNIPVLDPFWGRTNDKAFTATRIIRLEDEGKSTPYFLMVCRGEYPKVKSPRNDNAIFRGMYEPIFGDAFVFKLGDPELYADGYARYVHIEEDIGSIDWMPKAIWIAARKVEMAMASEANPGFPDLDNYADRETISKDSTRMLNWMRAIRKANRKYAKPFPVDATSGLPDLERIQDILKQWTRQVADWKREGVAPVDDSAEPSDVQKQEDFVGKAYDAYQATLDDDIDDDATEEDPTEDEDKIVSASTDTGSSDTETTNAAEEIQERFLAARAAFLRMEDVARKNISKKLLRQYCAAESSGGPDLKKTKAMLDEIMTRAALWKEEMALRPDGEVGYIDPKVVDELVVRIQRLYRIMEEGLDSALFVKATHDVNETYLSFVAQLDRQEAADRANHGSPDRPGASHYKV